MLRRTLATLISVVVLLVGPWNSRDGAGETRAVAPRLEIVIPADSAGTLYILGRKIVAPYRLRLADGRVLVNGIDLEPDALMAPSERFSDNPDFLATLDAVRTTTRRAQGAADSLLGSGLAREGVAAWVAETFSANPNVIEVRVLASGDLEISWRGVPGRQFVGLGPAGRAPRGGGDDPDASAIARLNDAAALLGRENLYAAGIGYRVSLSGGLADSLLAAIASFRVDSGDTLRAGSRRYAAFGADLRRARTGRADE